MLFLQSLASKKPNLKITSYGYFLKEVSESTVSFANSLIVHSLIIISFQAFRRPSSS